MDKKYLITLAKNNGFTGKDSEAPEWIKKNLDIRGDDGKPVDVDAVFAKKTVTIAVSADGGEDVQVVDESPAEQGGEDMAKGLTADEVAEYRTLKAEAVKSQRGKSDFAARIAGASGSLSINSPDGMARQSARKAYNAKAQHSKTNFVDADEVERFNAILRLNLAKRLGHDYAGKRFDLEIVGKDASTIVNTLGGALVPHEYIANLIYLTEPVGVARKLANVQRMSRDVTERPRKTAIVSMSPVGEGAALTTADATYDVVTLTAKKAGVILKFSNELFEDSAISIGDDAGNTIREAYDRRIDLDYFLGDGTSTYNGHSGLATALPSGAYINGAGSTWASLTKDNLTTVIGSFENVNTARIFGVCSRQFAWQVLKRLDTAANQFRELLGEANGTYDAVWMGIPIYYSQILPTASAGTTKSIYFGDFMGASMIGDRRDLTVDSSNQVYWANDQIGIKATARYAINVHGDGRGSTFGPITCLTTT